MNVYEALMRDGKERREAFERAKAVDQALFQAQEAAKDLARRLDDERERCAQIALNGCLVYPDGGSPTEDEAALCEEIARRIRGA